MRTYARLSIAVVVALAMGCEVPDLEPARESTTAQTAAAGSPASNESYGQRPGELFGKEDWYLPDGRVDMSGVPDEPPMTTGTPREITAKDPKQGKLTRKRGGALGADLQALPWAKNQTIFLMIKHNLDIYDAEKDHYPKSHKQFMEEFLPQYYNVPLPKLEPGDAYLYDPNDHLLKIFRPGDPGAPQVEGVVPYEAEPEDANEQ
jgi:hypothetical protein